MNSILALYLLSISVYKWYLVNYSEKCSLFREKKTHFKEDPCTLIIKKQDNILKFDLSSAASK